MLCHEFGEPLLHGLVDGDGSLVDPLSVGCPHGAHAQAGIALDGLPQLIEGLLLLVMILRDRLFDSLQRSLDGRRVLPLLERLDREDAVPSQFDIVDRFLPASLNRRWPSGRLSGSPDRPRGAAATALPPDLPAEEGCQKGLHLLLRPDGLFSSLVGSPIPAARSIAFSKALFTLSISFTPPCRPVLRP
ncbi:MAG: hypothetical protein MZV70_59195 [Desulfobacterales bacterium]|nr:hypothetical protein [Desulfobacterales bacterium]